MTMYPDPWPPSHARRVGLHITQATPPRHMEKLNRDPMRSVFDDERRETRGGMIVAALAGWSVIVFIVGLALVML